MEQTSEKEPLRFDNKKLKCATTTLTHLKIIIYRFKAVFGKADI